MHPANRFDCGIPVVVDTMQVDAVLALVRRDQGVARTQVRRLGVTHTAIVDDAHGADLAFARPVRVAYAHEVRVCIEQHFRKAIGRMAGVYARSVIEAGRDVLQQHAGRIRERRTLFDW